jgi:hypothetical protein
LFIFGHLIINIYMANKNNLTDIWNIYSDSIIKESKTTRPIEGGIKKMGTKPGPGAVELNSKEAKNIQNTGKEGTTDPDYDIEGVQEPIDPKKKKGDKENLYEPEKYSSEKFDRKVEKSYKESININMKSVFDKLFEEVMDGQDSAEELDALGIDAGDEPGEETGEVTVTLGAAHIDALKEILAQIEPEEGDDDEGEGEDEGEEGFTSFEQDEEDEDETVDEATELKEVPAAAGQKLTSKQNKVGSVKASGGKANGKLKKAGNGEGQDLPGSAGHKLTSKQNKVGGKAGATGGSLFA